MTPRHAERWLVAYTHSRALGNLPSCPIAGSTATVMTDLRYRLAIIAALIAASAWSIWPRPVVRRLETTNNVIQYDTVRRIPIRRGLDLEGGMHLTLEIDESKGAVANKTDAIDRALKVVRTRI